MAHYPKFIEESVTQSKAAAARAATVLSQKELKVGGIVAGVDQNKCVACLTCVRVCPYGAPHIIESGVAEIEMAKCRGCGICAAECPVKAIDLSNYRDKQVVSKTVALFKAVVSS
jgi:heterodisulfide reductase subunit A-like polyferredoxin